MSNKKISIIIPVFNEEKNLQPLFADLEGVIDQLSDHEIIFVDDGSTDKSLQVLKTIRENHKDDTVKIITFSKNYGQTAALGAGVRYATGEVMVLLDADGQNDPGDIPKLLVELEKGYDVVSGWRRKRHDAWLRVFLSKIANHLIAWITNVKINDYGCTLKVYRSTIIKKIDFHGEIHRLIPVYAAWQGAKVTELIVNHRPRLYGQSKYGFSRIIKVLLDLLVAKFLTSYSTKPIYFFGTIGLACFGGGALTFITAVFLKFFGVDFIKTPLLLLTVMLSVLGLQFLSMGLLADLVIGTRSKKDDYVYTVKELIGF